VQITLFDGQRDWEREDKIDRAADEIRRRYGSAKLVRAVELEAEGLIRI
jgi:hypothetical protein